MGIINKLFGKKKKDKYSLIEGGFISFSDPILPATSPISIPEKNLPISSIQRVAPKVLHYDVNHTRYGTNGFSPPEYELSEIGVVEDVDSIVRQAHRKKTALMFKEGFDFTGSNPILIQYINTRLAQIARASEVPTTDLLKRLGNSLIKYSNAFLLKMRDIEASGGMARISPEGKKLKPIACYFILPAETMKVKLDVDTGKIKQWRQQMPDGRFQDFSIDDICHFTLDKKEGFVFGTPALVPVLDDIRALRQIEENIELLTHQNLFPLFQYKVGTETAPAGTMEDGTKEVDFVRNIVQYMPPEGCIVTPERHDISAIGSEGRALRAEGYLNYFKLRVIAGMGISTIDLGEASTANRASARSLSRQLIDTVKDIQDSLEIQFREKVLAELLLESTLAKKIDILSKENIVSLRFKEIDIENRIDQEQHATEMFKANGLTYDEYRIELGREPIVLPEDPQDQDHNKYPDWFKTYWKLFDEPTQLIRAVDEPYSVYAQVAAENRSLAITGGQVASAKQAQEEQANKKAEQDRKAKQTSGNIKKKQDSIELRQYYGELESDVLERIKTLSLSGSHPLDNVVIQSVERLTNIWTNITHDKLIKSCESELVSGYMNQMGRIDNSSLSVLAIGRSEIGKRCNYYIQSLNRDILSGLKSRLSVIDVKNSDFINQVISSIRDVFQALRYRIELMSDVEMRKSYIYGRILGMRLDNTIEGISSISNEQSCERCRIQSGMIYNIHQMDLDTVLPHHSHCSCELRVVKK